MKRHLGACMICKKYKHRGASAPLTPKQENEMKALRENGIWKFRTKNFEVIVDSNDGVWRTRVFCRHDEIVRQYCGAPRLGVLRAIAEARHEMHGSNRFRINQR